MLNERSLRTPTEITRSSHSDLHDVGTQDEALVPDLGHSVRRNSWLQQARAGLLLCARCILHANKRYNINIAYLDPTVGPPNY